MIARASGDLWDNALKTQITQAQFVYKDIDNPDGVIVCDVFIEPFGGIKCSGFGLRLQRNAS